MKPWRLLPTLSAPMPFQMAFDEGLFYDCLGRSESGDSPVGPILRFYYSYGAWTTLGYADSAAGKPGGAALPARHCRRITGGGRVQHGDDLLLSIVGCREDHQAFKSVRISYLKIHETIKEALEQMGLSLRFYRCDEPLPKGADCFRFPIATDLAHRGRKIAGGAQKRSKNIFLHQESIRMKGIDYARLIGAFCNRFERNFSVTLQHFQ